MFSKNIDEETWKFLWKQYVEADPETLSRDALYLCRELLLTEVENLKKIVRK